nr:SE1832 family protein [Planococcus sp. ISL-110]
MEYAITELKMNYAHHQGDIEKLEATGHGGMVEKAELRLEKMELQLAELNQKLADL